MPRRRHEYFVYITASKSGALYTGMTNNLFRRMWQHKAKIFPGHTSKYNIDRLVHFESYQYVWDAIEREKEIKLWIRIKKIRLINENNPEWRDLAEDWYDEIDPDKPPAPKW
jgi:putative endonuclease